MGGLANSMKGCGDAGASGAEAWGAGTRGTATVAPQGEGSPGWGRSERQKGKMGFKRQDGVRWRASQRRRRSWRES